MCTHTHLFSSFVQLRTCSKCGWIEGIHVCGDTGRLMKAFLQSLLLFLFMPVLFPVALCLSSKLNYSFDVAIRDGFSPLCRDHLRFWNMFCKGTHSYLRGSLRIHTHTHKHKSRLSLPSHTSSALPNVSQSIPRSMSMLFLKDSHRKQPEGLIMFPTNS